MKRFAVVVAAVLAALIGTLVPAAAQETRFDLAGGIQYPLLSQSFDIQQNLGWRVKPGVRITPALTISAVYESYSTTSDVPNEPDGDVTQHLYGATATLVLNGEQDFQLIGFVSLGAGKLDFKNPGFALPPGLVSNTSLRWYEIGGGAQFALSKRWVLRIQLSGRQTQPQDPCIVLKNTRFSLVPSAEIGLRF